MWDEGHTAVTPEFIAPWQQVLHDLRYRHVHGAWEDGIEPMWAVSLAQAVGDDPAGERVAYVANKYVVDSMEKDLQDALTLLVTLSTQYEEVTMGNPTAEAIITLGVIRRKVRAHIVLGTFTNDDES